MSKDEQPYYSGYRGRKTVFTDYTAIDETNILDVLQDTLSIHAFNMCQIRYLFNYYRGTQPILEKSKEVRPDINNVIVENHAKEIVDFKTGYLLNQNIEYVSKGGVNADAITDLNSYMEYENKSSLDQQVVHDMHICGIAFRGIFAKEENPALGLEIEDGESPFDIYVLNPMSTYVVRTTALGNKVVLGVTITNRIDGNVIYTCYTPTQVFTVTSETESAVTGAQFEVSDNGLGFIPIIEYQLSESRMGAFEPVLSILDAINRAQSDRLDGLDQFIQSLLIFHNVDIDLDQFDELKERGGLSFKDISDTMKGDVSYLNQQLDQSTTQKLVDNLYDMLLKVVGLPQRSGGSGSSTSDTGSAVVLRDGYYQAEVNARSAELQFDMSEKEFIADAIAVCQIRANELNDLNVADIEIQFTRRNYENIQVKSQVLTTMLTCSDKSGNRLIDPSIAFESCGLFSDPDRKAKISQEFHDAEEKKSDEKAQQIALGQAQQMGLANRKTPADSSDSSNTEKKSPTKKGEDDDA